MRSTSWWWPSRERSKAVSFSSIAVPRCQGSGSATRSWHGAISQSTGTSRARAWKEWDYCYITPQQAAGILGVSVDDLQTMSNPPLSHDFGGEHGIRYWREWVEARTKGSLVPPGWADGVDPHSAVDSDEWSNADEDPDEIGD
jgi:hypothetical protein